MTEDQLQAESRKYLALHILPLTSGLFALYAPTRQLLHIGTGEEILSLVSNYDVLQHCATSRAAPPDIDLDSIVI